MATTTQGACRVGTFMEPSTPRGNAVNSVSPACTACELQDRRGVRLRKSATIHHIIGLLRPPGEWWVKARCSSAMTCSAMPARRRVACSVPARVRAPRTFGSLTVMSIRPVQRVITNYLKVLPMRKRGGRDDAVMMPGMPVPGCWPASTCGWRRIWRIARHALPGPDLVIAG